MNIQKMLDNLKLVDDKLDVEGFSGIGPCRTAIAEVGAFLQQLLNKRDVVRCKELLEQMYNEGMKADKGNDNELLALRIVISMLEVRPAL